MTKEEYFDKCFKETYIQDLIYIDYHDELKYYIGLRYDESFPEKDWFCVLLKVYKDNQEQPTLYRNVRIYSDYKEERKANRKEQKIFLNELYKRGWELEETEDFRFKDYKINTFKKYFKI